MSSGLLFPPFIETRVPRPLGDARTGRLITQCKQTSPGNVRSTACISCSLQTISPGIPKLQMRPADESRQGKRNFGWSHQGSLLGASRGIA